MSVRRSGVVVVVVLVLLVASSSVAAFAATKRAKGVSTERGVDHQKIIWRSGANNVTATSSTKWQTLSMHDGGCAPGSDACGGDTALLIQSSGDIAVTFSGNFTRAPVELRVRDSGNVMRPGPAKFKPVKYGESFSYTFVSLGKSQNCRDLVFEWRSPTGKEVRMQRASAVVNYKYTKQSPRVGCA